MTREMSRNQTRDVEPADESLAEIIRPREGTGRYPAASGSDRFWIPHGDRESARERNGDGEGEEMNSGRARLKRSEF